MAQNEMVPVPQLTIGSVAKERGYGVVSLDLNDADINCNILDGDFLNILVRILILCHF